MTAPDTPDMPDSLPSDDMPPFATGLDTRPVWDENAGLAALENAMRIISEDIAPDGSELADQREPLLWEFVNMLHEQIQRLNQDLDQLAIEARRVDEAQDASDDKADELQRLTNRTKSLDQRRDAFVTLHEKAAETYRSETGKLWISRDSSQ